MRERPRSWRSHAVRRPEEPVGWVLPSPPACLGLFLATRGNPSERGRPFRDVERVLEALAHGALDLEETIRVDRRLTTVGRFLVGQCLPPAYRTNAEARALTASRLQLLLARVTREHHVELAARAAAALERLGRSVADRSGFSLARHDFDGPPQKDAIIAAAMALVRRVVGESLSGQITEFDRHLESLDLWHATRDQVRAAARAEAPEADRLAALVAAQLEATLPEDLRTMRGLVKTYAMGEPWEAPVLHSRREGLTPHEFMMSSQAARRATLEQGERDVVAATLLHDLHAVMGATVITARDCGTQRGLLVSRLEANGDGVALELPARIEGRVTARDVVSADGEVVARARTLITRALAERIDATTASVLLLDPATCEADGGVCAACFGLDPDDATWPVIGDEVGARAAMTITAEARTMMTHYFQIC